MIQLPIKSLTAATLLSLSALANASAHAEVAVAVGRSVTLRTFFSLDQLCRSQGPIQINIVAPPRGGVLRVNQTRAFPNFNTLNTRSRCNFVQRPATRVAYQSTGNYIGPDVAAIEVIFPTGTVERVQFGISIRPIAPGF